MLNIKKYNYLKKGLNKKSGRNFRGKITVYHKGGGNKINYRIIDFKHINKQGRVINIEYDPNRSCYIALCYNEITNKYFYTLAPQNLKKNDNIITYDLNNLLKTREIKIGYTMPLYNIPLNIPIFNIETIYNKCGSLVRSAGNFAFIIKKDSDINGFAYIKLNNKRIKKIPLMCSATIGKLSNQYHDLYNYKKAGRIRNLNIRPTVRGVAMNPIDHPHGGGEGKASGGRVSVTPWGLITKGRKTVKNKNHE